MSAAADLTSFVTCIANVDVSILGDDEVTQLVVAAERLVNAAHVLSAVALEEFERRGRWADDGALSAAGWVAARTGTASRTARSRVREGRGLLRLPRAAGPARAGWLSPTT